MEYLCTTRAKPICTHACKMHPWERPHLPLGQQLLKKSVSGQTEHIVRKNTIRASCMLIGRRFRILLVAYLVDWILNIFQNEEKKREFPKIQNDPISKMRRFYAKSWYFHQMVLRKSPIQATPTKWWKRDNGQQDTNMEHQSQVCMQKTRKLSTKKG